MAEIVGAVASGITVLGATITVADAILSFISQLRNAPEEIAFLHTEVNDTRLILSNINENASRDQSFQTQVALPDNAGIYGDPENISKAEFLVKRINRVLKQAENALKEVTKSKYNYRVTIHQKAWLMNRSKIRSLRGELRELKTSLAVHFAVGTGTLATRTILLLKRVLLENARSAQLEEDRDNQMDMKLRDVAQQLVELTTMRESQRQLIALVQSLNDTVITSERRIRETITTTTTTVTSTTARQLIQNGHPTTETTAETSTTTAVSTESISKLKLEFSRFQKRAVCQIILGELFVGFSNLPMLSRPCSDSRCTQRSPFSATVTYHLPSLLLNKLVSVIFITTAQGDPAACIKVRPLNNDFSIYRAVEDNNLGKVRDMITRRAAHPSAGFNGGWTPLHYAISYGYTAICKSLLAAGADPLMEDGTNQLSPLEWAWSRILGGAYEDHTQREMEELFSDRDCLEEMGFTTLHRIIIGLDPSPLETYLAVNPECINTVDFSGRTPLSWAAQRGMSDSVLELLRLGADPNICTAKGHSPLQFAAEARNPDSIQPLLNYGAKVDQPDVEGQTALHYAVIRQRDSSYYRPLISAGADTDWPTIWKATPLCTAISVHHDAGAAYLIECGANIDLKGQGERPPVFYAVEYNNHAMLTLLYERGATLTGSSTAYPSIAHVAAHHADIKTLRILTALRLELENVDCVGKNGLTIPQIVDKRLGSNSNDEGLVLAFGFFLESIRVRSGVRDSDSADNASEDEYFDSVEELASTTMT